MQVFAQSDKSKTPKVIEVRTMTRDEVLNVCGHVEVILNNGRLGRVKINGAVRTWKRDADRVEIPVKYGMYEYAVLDLAEALRRFIVRI